MCEVALDNSPSVIGQDLFLRFHVSSLRAERFVASVRRKARDAILGNSSSTHAIQTIRRIPYPYKLGRSREYGSAFTA